jgi:hypothetical protein
MDSCEHCKALLPPESMFFCPDCGQIIMYDHKMRAKRNSKRVGMRTQVLLAIIPLVSLVSAYRVKKIKKSLVIYFSSMAAAAFLLVLVLISSGVSRNESYYYGSDSYILAMMGLILGALLSPSIMMVYFIRKWSTRWNKQVTFLEYVQ